MMTPNLLMLGKFRKQHICSTVWHFVRFNAVEGVLEGLCTNNNKVTFYSFVMVILGRLLKATVVQDVGT